MVTPLESWSIEHFISNREQCLKFLEDADFLNEIPDLDSESLDNLKHGQLVKFQGMIQDMRNPEFYYEKYIVKNINTEQLDIRNGKYSDMINISNEEELVESENNQSNERLSFIVISVPGLNKWTRKQTSENKDNFYNNIFDILVPTSNSNKRQVEEMEVDETNVTSKKSKSDSDSTQESSVKKTEDKDKRLLLSTEYMLNLPIPGENGKSCIVKIYEEDSKNFKLNQVIDIIGFISLDPNLSVFHDSQEMATDLEIQAHNPPASIIPRLHAIKVTHQQKPTLHRNPTLFSTFETIRGELHKILRHLLFQDSVAADYLICHLISSIYKRSDYLCLGAFPLNITNFPLIKQQQSTSSEEQKAIFPKALYSFISAVLPKSVYLECTLDNLNNLTFVPKKDYDCNRLTSGILQLSPNTHLIVDETNLTSGKVSPNGRINYNALCEIISGQKLNYDFKFYQMEYETDIPVLILSEVASFINGAVRLPIKSSEKGDAYLGVMDAVSMYMNDDKIVNLIRDYLYYLKFADFKIDDEISDIIQHDLVQLKSSNEKITADDFHRFMVFSRLMALSHGLETLTLESWKESFGLEADRMDRVRLLTESQKK